MPSQINRFTFSNLVGVEDAHYCSAHGRSPGILTVTTRVYPFNLNYYSQAAFTDGTNTYIIPDCRVKSIQHSKSAAGESWMVEVEDHRWRWTNSLISGEYNAEDKRGNLIPGMIKTPKELAVICLDRLGETEYEVDMPEGVKEGQGPKDEFPAPGEGIKSVKAELNPPIHWENISTAEALVRLCEVYDRVVIWCNIDRKVKILKRSTGEGLPGGFIENGSDTLLLPPLPAGIGIIGAELRFQARLATEDVGMEYDGRLRKIDDLSYAPDIDPKPAAYQAKILGDYLISTVYSITVNGVTFSTSFDGSIAAALASLAGQISSDTVLQSQVTSYVSGDQLIITGVNNGQTVDITANFLRVLLIESPVENKWEISCPPLFPGINAPQTGGPDRLSYRQALAKAQGSIFRTRRITLLDPSRGPLDPPESLYIRHFGYVTSYHQILLDQTLVEQVTPQPRDPDRITPGTGDKVADVPDYYDGWSRDRSHVVYGSIMQKISAPVHRVYRGEKTGSARYNTDFKDRVEVNSSIDPTNWAVVFDTQVYEYHPVTGGFAKVKRARLVLETSFKLRDPKTHEVVRYRRWVKFGRQESTDKTKEKRDEPKKLARLDNDEDCLRYDRDPNILWFDHSDEVFRTWIQTYVVDEERRRHTVTGSINDEYDNAREAADAYIDKHIERIILEGGYTRTYRECKPIRLNGAIREVTFEFNGDAMTTTGSFNREHDSYIPRNDVRRFREALTPNVEAAQQNRDFAKQINAMGARMQERMAKQGLARKAGG